MSKGKLFKTGVIVADLERAMSEIGRWLDLEWTPIQQSPMRLATANGREELQLRFAYSRGEPPFLELLEAQPSGYYAAPAGSHIHHVGRWVDDLPAACAELAARGMPLEASGIDPEGKTPAVFAFHKGAHGMRVELVDSAMQPGFEAWLAGGELILE